MLTTGCIGDAGAVFCYIDEGEVEAGSVLSVPHTAQQLEEQERIERDFPGKASIAHLLTVSSVCYVYLRQMHGWAPFDLTRLALLPMKWMATLIFFALNCACRHFSPPTVTLRRSIQSWSGSCAFLSMVHHDRTCILTAFKI